MKGNRLFHCDNTSEYEGTYDKTKVEIVGWEYGQFVNEIEFSTSRTNELPTHAIAWVRPIFAPKAPEGFVRVDAHDCWPVTGRAIRSESTGELVEQPPKGTWILVPLPKDFNA